MSDDKFSILNWRFGQSERNGIKEAEHLSKNDEPVSDLTDSSWPTKYWHEIPESVPEASEFGKEPKAGSATPRIQCDLCPRECKLREGQQGLCFVRACQGGEIVLTSYGRSSGFCIDPIEKKPLNHFLPGSPVLSFGTAGCNLACKFCQNWDISKSREMSRLAERATPAALVNAAVMHGAQSIAFTYNDPIIFHEYAIDVASIARESGINSIAVTAGYVNPEPRVEFFSVMDAANVDLKGFTQRFYRRVCGGRLNTVLDTLLYIHNETNVWLEVTTLLIPGENDNPVELEQMCRWIVDNLGVDVPLHFTAFHPDYKMLETPATSVASLRAARDIARAAGINHVYLGNVHDAEASSTYCPDCGECLIERDWYVLGVWNLDTQGCCGHCGSWIAGVFGENPGDWGAKRQVVRLSG